MTLTQFLIWYSIAVQPHVILSENIRPIIQDLRQVYTGKVLITSNSRSWGVKNTRHKCGKAIDIRLWHLSKQNILDILRLKAYNYKVLVESNHIHIAIKEKC